MKATNAVEEKLQVFTKGDNTKTFKKNVNFALHEEQMYLELKNNKLLTLAISRLPENYNFEIYKSIEKILTLKNELKIVRKPKIALQMPDGFVIYSLLIVDILEKFGECECIVLGDITYGACCIDDLGARVLGCDFIIHYGHSCLIPITETCLKVLYIFVEIEIDIDHLIQTMKLNFPERDKNIVVLGSIQFNNALFICKNELLESGYTNVQIPQTKPRSTGEVLGCTSPIIPYNKNEEKPIVVFVCDGRFHMEAAMIANPDLTFFQYNPYTKSISLERYDFPLMKKIRKTMIDKSRNAKVVGILFGILGRQGSPDVLKNVISLMEKNSLKYYIILLSEMTEELMSNYSDVETFVQIACPRISIDWGSFFTKPVITSYEANVAWGSAEWSESSYPMDYYSYEGGEWSNFYLKKPKSYKNKK